jgi:hypothetical protein
LLPGTEGAVYPFWKPDSRAVGFFATGKVRAVSLTGGAPTVICDSPPMLPDSMFTGGAVLGGAWNARDDVVFGGANGLWHAQFGTPGRSRQVRAPSPGETLYGWPSFLPDGTHFLFLVRRGPTNEVRIGSLESDATTSLGTYASEVNFAAGHLFFVRDGNLLAQPFDPAALRTTGEPQIFDVLAGVDPIWADGMFSVSSSSLAYRQVARPTRDLTWHDRAGAILGTVGRPGVYANIDLGPGGRRVAASRLGESPQAAQSDIWLLQPDGGEGRLTTTPVFEWDPSWAPDGSQVAYTSDRGDAFAPGLFRRRADGRGAEQLLDRPDPDGRRTLTMPTWTPDGRTIVYTQSTAQTGLDLWLVNAEGAPRPRPFLATPFVESEPAVSPDGRWIAYESNETGRLEIYVRAFPSGDGPYQVSRQGGRSARWRGDGREIFFVSDEGTMMAADADTRGAFHGGAPRVLFRPPARPGNRSYAVTADGQRFLIVKARPELSITLLLNWPARLARQRGR